MSLCHPDRIQIGSDTYIHILYMVYIGLDFTSLAFLMSNPGIFSLIIQYKYKNKKIYTNIYRDASQDLRSFFKISGQPKGGVIYSSSDCVSVSQSLCS